MINVKSSISSRQSRRYFTLDYVKEIFSASNFVEALVPVKILGLCFGVMPFDFILEGGHIRAVINIPSGVVALAGFMGYLYCIWKILIFEEMKKNVESKFAIIQSVSNFFCIVLGIIAMVFIFFSVFASGHADAKTMELLTEIDEIFDELNEKKDFSNIKMKTIGRLALFYVTQITLVSVNLYFMSTLMLYTSHEMGIAVYAPGFISCTILIIFRTYVNLLNENTAVLNRLLRNTLTRHDESNSELSSKALKRVVLKEPLYNIYLKSQDNSKRLKVLFKINDKICDCAENINRAYGFRNLIVITLAFVCDVFYVFNALATIVSSTGRKISKRDILFLYFSLSQLAMYTFVLYGTVHGCEECQNKVINYSFDSHIRIPYIPALYLLSARQKRPSSLFSVPVPYSTVISFSIV